MVTTESINQNGGAGDAPEPIAGDRGAPILGPRNLPIEQQNPDVLIAPVTDGGTVPNLKWPFALSHNRVLSGGFARETTTRELPISTEIAGVNMRLKPGGIRELHWHKEAEWAYMIAGTCRVSVLDEQGRLFIDDVSVGDLWYFPAGLPHSIQALADGCEFLLVFDSGDFSENETFLITDWFNHTPRDVLAKNFGVAESAFDNLPTDIGHTRYVFAGAVPPALVDDAPPYPATQPPQSYTWHMHAQEPIKTPGWTAADHRLAQLHGLQDDRRGADRDRAGRDARAALASQLRRVAVLPQGAGPDDGIRLRWQVPNVRLPGR